MKEYGKDCGHMDMKGSLEEAKTLYEKAKAARTEKRYSLNDITDIEFDLLKKWT